MKSSNDVTVTDARMKNALRQQVNPIIMESVPQMISQAITNVQIQSGIVIKFYPYLDKAEVQLDNSNQNVLCRLPHRFVGALIDFYVPVGEESFCDDLHEPCILPRDPLYCLVVDINDGSDNYLLVDYYLADDIIGFAPPSQGSVRITNFRASSEDYIEFGGDGLKIQTKNPIQTSYGEYEDDLTVPVYADSDDVYTKEELYTKEEVDELIAEKVAEDTADINKLIILALGVGVFTVEDNHLFVELPATVSNPFSIENGHLMVEWKGNNPFWIENDKLYYEEVK